MPCLHSQDISRRSVREALGLRLGDRSHRIRLFVTVEARGESKQGWRVTGFFVRIRTAVEKHFCAGGETIHTRLHCGECFFIRGYRAAPTA